MSEDLRRQRRNLILTSFILWFMKYGGINISKTTILGVEVTFSNSAAIFLGFWLMWIYFAVRYYQYFMQEAVPKIAASFKDLITVNCRPKIKSIVISKYPRAEQLISDNEYDYSRLQKSNWRTIRFVGSQILEGDSFGKLETFAMDISLWELKKGILSSCVTLILNQSTITDYVFPMLLGLYTLIYCNIGNWPGSLRNIF
jgi:hypothetical protein